MKLFAPFTLKNLSLRNRKQDYKSRIILNNLHRLGKGNGSKKAPYGAGNEGTQGLETSFVPAFVIS